MGRMGSKGKFPRDSLKFKARKGQFDDHDKIYKKSKKKKKSSEPTILLTMDKNQIKSLIFIIN